jgi:hypothetical protein
MSGLVWYKLDCFITLSWKGLTVTNTLTYWDSSSAMKEIKYCEYAPRSGSREDSGGYGKMSPGHVKQRTCEYNLP